jgi:hypothetical protein
MLNVSLGYVPSVGDQIMIINNMATPAAGNPIAGTFANLAQGATISASYGGTTYCLRVDYTGGDGNDLVLTAVANPASLPGDANDDGVVDDRDASILGAHWQQQSGATWAMGDFNDDGKVNDVDAAILAAHWGATLPAEEQPAEPVELGIPDRIRFVGPLPAGATPARRRLLEPVGRGENAAAMAMGPLADGPSPRETAAARDAVVAKEYGPQHDKQPTQIRQRLARSYTLTCRKSHEREDKILDNAGLAIDLLLRDRPD